MDISLLRCPEEVYLAAIGDTAALAERLRSDVELLPQEREALALLVEGKLQEPKRGRGENRPRYLFGALHDYQAYCEVMDLPHAEDFYKFIMGRLREAGNGYGRAAKVLAFVAQECRVDPDRLSNYMRRPKAEKDRRRVRSAEGGVERFHYWLYHTGRLPF